MVKVCYLINRHLFNLTDLKYRTTSVRPTPSASPHKSFILVCEFSPSSLLEEGSNELSPLKEERGQQRDERSY